MDEEMPVSEFADISMAQARRMRRGPRMEPMLYEVEGNPDGAMWGTFNTA
jgi:hypothetical protein